MTHFVDLHSFIFYICHSQFSLLAALHKTRSLQHIPLVHYIIKRHAVVVALLLIIHSFPISITRTLLGFLSIFQLRPNHLFPRVLLFAGSRLVSSRYMATARFGAGGGGVTRFT